MHKAATLSGAWRLFQFFIQEAKIELEANEPHASWA
jgi:hypothetical protein